MWSFVEPHRVLGWHPILFQILHTTNPPLGAFACYVVGDILAIKVTRWLTPSLLRVVNAFPRLHGVAGLGRALTRQAPASIFLEASCSITRILVSAQTVSSVV